jgi:Flp pilus assembly protein TadG
MSNHIRSIIGNHSRVASIGQRRAWLFLGGAALDLLGRFRASESGNIAIIAAITLPLTAGAVGVAISYSTVNAVRSNMQAALDAAVLAGAGALDTIGGSNPLTTANDVFAGNTSKFVNTEATAIAANFTLADPTVSGTASGSVVNPFSGLIGPKTIPVTVKAAATKLTTPICVLGLNGLENGSFDINGSKATFTATCAVQANTDSKSGMSSEGQPTATAKKFSVAGGHKGDAFSHRPPSTVRPKLPILMPRPRFRARPRAPASTTAMARAWMSATIPRCRPALIAAGSTSSATARMSPCSRASTS